MMRRQKSKMFHRYDTNVISTPLILTKIVNMLRSFINPSLVLSTRVSSLTYIDCLFDSERRARVLCTVQICQEHGVDQRGFAEAGLSYKSNMARNCYINAYFFGCVWDNIC